MKENTTSALTLRTAFRMSLLLAAMSAGGCSFVFTHGPPAQHAKVDYFDCSTSRVPPILDTLFGAFQAVRVGYALTADDSDYEDFPLSREADIGIGFVLLALATGSAIYGYCTTAECSEAKARMQKRMKRRSEERAIPPPRPAALPMCASDVQCKGNRICENGRCVTPPPGTFPPQQEPAPAAGEPQPPPGTLQPQQEPAPAAGELQPPAAEPNP